MKISTLVSCLLAAPVAYGAVIKRGPCHENNLFRALKRIQRELDPTFCSRFLRDDTTPYPPNERNVPVSTPKADVANACGCLLNNYLGLEVAIYENPYIWTYGYPDFDHSYVATKEPWGTATAKSLGEDQVNNPAQDEPHRYGLPAPNGLVYTLNFRGYFLCPAAGTFSLTISHVDDVAYVWTGEEAKCGWTNSVLPAGTAIRSDWPEASKSLGFTCTKGAYIPLRIVWADESGPRGWGFNIQDDSGNYYVQNKLESPFLFKQSPDNTPGPFPGSFGAEPTVCV